MTRMNTTQWQSTSDKIGSVDTAVGCFMTNNQKDTIELRSNSYTDIKVEKVYEDVQEDTFLESTIKFNALTGSFKKITEASIANGDVNTVNFFVIVYERNGIISFIINRNTDAKTILRSFLGIEERDTIVNSNIELNSDMLLYFVYRVFMNKDEFSYTLSSQDDLEITVTDLIGIKGATVTSNRLSADGDTISKLISTLSLLLEVTDLQEVCINTRVGGEHQQISMLLKENGLIGVEITDYTGSFENKPSNERRTYLLLYVYLVVLPVILSEYRGSSEDEWGTIVINDFLQSLKDQLISKLDGVKAETNNMDLE